MPTTLWDGSARLVERFYQGDRTAFDDLFRRHRQRVFDLVLRMTGDPDLANDITIDVFVEAYRTLPTFRGRSSFATWLHRVAVNVCLEHLRRARNRLTEVPLSEDAASPAESPAEVAVTNELVAQITEAIGSLPSPHRITVELFYLEGMSCREIAARLGIPRNTVKTRLFYATRALRAKLMPESGLLPPSKTIRAV